MKKTIISFFVFLLAACSHPTPEIMSPTPEPESVVFSTATLQPTQTLWLTSTPGPTYTPNATKTEAAKATPTLDLMSLTEPWKTYTDRELGISFDYPAIFDDMEGCEIISTEREGNTALSDFFGYKNWYEILIGNGRFQIARVDVGEMSLSEAVDYMMLNSPYGSFIISRLEKTIGDYDTIQVETSFSGVTHYFYLTFFKKNQNVFVVIKNSYDACSLSEENSVKRKLHLVEYFRIVESIRFLN